MGKKIKLIVAIRSPVKMKERRKAIRETWGKDFIEHGAEVFFVISGCRRYESVLTTEFKEDILYTPGTDSHGDLTNRMVWLWRFLKNRSFTHVLVMDDDCSVNVPFFMKLPWGESEAWGHNNGGYLSGCAAVFSSATIEKLNYNMPKDDVVIGALLSKLGIKMEHSKKAVRPWLSKGQKSSFGQPDVAIQHYIRSPEQIIENHSKLSWNCGGPIPPPAKSAGDEKRNVSTSKVVKNIEFILSKNLLSHTSEIYVDKNKRYILKKLIKHQEHDCIKRESHVLKLLNSKGYDWVPKLIYSEDEMIITEYVGEPINKTNIPLDHKKQIKKILQDLKDNNIKHNDIKKSEILVKDGKMYLCDFGWASINDDFSCGINISNKKKIHGIFKDERIIKALDSTAASFSTAPPRIWLNSETGATHNSNSRPEKHLVVDWTNFFSETEAVNNIRSYDLEVAEIIHMDKLENKSEIISKFYDTKVNDFRGSSNFTVYVVDCVECPYDYRKTSKGRRLVNIKLFDLKQALRKKAGGYKIHATDNIQETKDNLKALGLYEKHYNREEFKDISEVFDTLNKLKGFKYVVMRNFEGIPDDIIIDEHLDIDLLVSNYYQAKVALDASSVLKAGFNIKPNQRHENGGCRILNNVRIDGKEVWFDLRYMGDDYYDINLEKHMLDGRVKHKNFYIPDKETHLYTLIYHAIIHKSNISKTYKKIFMANGIEEKDVNVGYLFNLLKEYMDKNNFKCTRPKDNSVGFVRRDPSIKEWCC